MPVLKVFKDGVWEEVAGVSGHANSVNDIVDFPSSMPANGGDADTVDGKHASFFATASHGTHVTYSTSNPKMNGTASAGTNSAVSRGDHVHPTDTTRASSSDLNALKNLVGTTAVSTQISDALANFSSGKTLTEHLAEENMVLTSLQYGDTLPSPGIPGRIFFLKVSD